MATLPIFITHIQCSRQSLGPHEKQAKRYAEEPATTGEHLKKRRLDLGRTQEQIAARFGITLTAYNAWEGDRHHPAAKYWPTVIEFLGYDPTSLPTSLDEALMALQRRHGIDRESLAVRLGIERKSLFNWIHGRSSPFASMRRKMLSSGLPGIEGLLPFL